MMGVWAAVDAGVCRRWVSGRYGGRGMPAVSTGGDLVRDAKGGGSCGMKRTGKYGRWDGWEVACTCICMVPCGVS